MTRLAIQSLRTIANLVLLLASWAGLLLLASIAGPLNKPIDRYRRDE